MLTGHIWEKLKSNGTCEIEATVAMLPAIENSDALPYKDKSGQLSSFVMLELLHVLRCSLFCSRRGQGGDEQNYCGQEFPC